MQELARVAKKIKALAIADVPAGITGRGAIDWHRGLGLYTGKGTVDSANLEIFWGWFDYIDPFTGLLKRVPPTLGVLEAMARTFDTDKPWKAVAGETRGVITSALSLEFPKLAEDVRQAMSAVGNSINPILRMRGRHVIYGERTMQVADSKLLAAHNVILVNFIVTSLGEIGRRFVFDPNDPELLVQINLGFSDFLDRLRNERGLEDYNLIIDKRNNTPETRNQRQVIVDLSIIPVDVMERMFIRCSVISSGADILSVA
jgi:phage tail sheath protein FI